MPIIKNNKNHARKVAVVLPYVQKTVLMQLRDMKSEIEFPGCWGFFGGSIETGEKPKESALRELFEELNYKPAILYKLGIEYDPEARVLAHYFYCSLTISVNDIVLKEGQDCALFSLEEIKLNKLYSKKLRLIFPVVPTKHIVRYANKLFSCVGDTALNVF